MTEVVCPAVTDLAAYCACRCAGRAQSFCRLLQCLIASHYTTNASSELVQDNTATPDWGKPPPQQDASRSRQPVRCVHTVVGHP